MSLLRKYKGNTVFHSAFREGSKVKQVNSDISSVSMNNKPLGKGGFKLDSNNQRIDYNFIDTDVRTYSTWTMVFRWNKLDCSKDASVNLFFSNNGSKMRFDSNNTGFITLTSNGVGEVYPNYTNLLNINSLILVCDGGNVRTYEDGLLVHTTSSLALTLQTAVKIGSTNGYEADGLFTDFMFLDTDISAVEVSRLASEMNNHIDSRVNSTALAKTYPQDAQVMNVLKDWDMEMSGVTSWTVYTGATIEKSTTDPYKGAQSLKLTCAGASNSGTNQTVLVSGQRYVIEGVYKSQAGATPRIFVGGGSTSWQGLSGVTSWTRFSIDVVADGTNLYLVGNNSDGLTVEFDHISVRPYMNSYLRITRKGEIRATANSSTVSSGQLENTHLRINSGSFKVVDDTLNNTKCKVIECVTAGELVLPMRSAYGKWQYYLNKASASYSSVFIVSVPQTGFSSTYLLGIDPNESVRLLKNGGTVFATASAYVNAGEYIGIKVRRKTNNEFSIYVDSGDGFELATAVSGTNPLTDSTTTENNFIRLDLDAGDKIIWSSENHLYDFHQEA